MKVLGKKISAPKPEIIVIPRPLEDGGNEDIVFMTQPVLDFSEFEALCPIPLPPIQTMRGGEKRELTDDIKYLSKIGQHSRKKFSWMILKSLQATKDLEWDTVKMVDPDTWDNYEKEMKDSGLTQNEINRIIECVMIANSMSDAKFKQARDRFIQTQAGKV